MRYLRTVAALGACGGLLFGGVASPAHAAAGGGTLVGTMHINCFGCGQTSGSAALTFTGVARGQRFVTAPVNFVFTFTNSASTACLAGGASGSYSGAIDGTFTMAFGPVPASQAVLTLQGDINGVGDMTTVVTTPKAVLCEGVPLNADVAIAVAGN